LSVRSTKQQAGNFLTIGEDMLASNIFVYTHMKKTHTWVVGTATLALAATAMIPAVFAAELEPTAENAEARTERRMQKKAAHEAVKEAIEAGDYAAFLEAVPEEGKLAEITQGQFESLKTMHALLEEGNVEEAQAIAEELGLPLRGVKGNRGRGESFSSEDHEARKAALLAGDYETFTSLMGDHPRAEQLTAEVFAQMSEVVVLRESGDLEGAQALAESYGLKGPKMMNKEARNEQHAAISAAIEAGDYAAFLAATEGTPRAELSQEQFEVLKEMHALRQAGDMDGARALAEEAGLEMKQGKRGMRGHRMMQESAEAEA
jgi:hypothetical protein